MYTNKIIRSICLFRENPSQEDIVDLDQLEQKLAASGFLVQTKRICTKPGNLPETESKIGDPGMRVNIGSLDLAMAEKCLSDFYQSKNIYFSLDLTQGDISSRHVDILFGIIKNSPDKTFNFSFVFNNPTGSPYFPSANYAQDGFSVGLQATNLAVECVALDEWLAQMKIAWREVCEIFSDRPDFLGIDSSVAPLFQGKESLINFAKKICGSFSLSATSDFYLRITEFIKRENPKPVGLCGLMLPCLEDFELAEEYEQGNFPLERNLFLSLHSGLGIDTYPIGMDEDPMRVVEILKLVQRLSNKYHKPLSARFVSDGRAKIGDRTDFKNQYLKDVIVRKL